MLKIIPIGGYREVGKNCTVVQVDDEMIILDMGLHIENYIRYTEDEDVIKADPRELIKAKALPDTSFLEKNREKIKGIFVSHAHLDHIAALPYLAGRFKCNIYGTRFSIEVLKAILKDDNINLPNKLISHAVNSKMVVSDKISVEFIKIAHSCPQTSMLAVHTPYGIVLYSNDFKFDKTPTLGKKSNIKRLMELRGKIKALIVDSLYADTPHKTASEAIAKELLEEVLLNSDTEKKAVIVTTFSSHLARLKSIVECSRKMKRKPVFLGRSLAKYTHAGKQANIIDFEDDIEIIKYSKKVKKFLKNLKNPEKYLLVMTGNQGEPKAILARVVFEKWFDFSPGDFVVFSCSTIPTETNKENRKRLERALKIKRARIFTDVHVSGHASREDHRDLIKMIRPEILLPSHSDFETSKEFAELAEEEGYKEGKNVFVLENKKELILK
ncbi:RNase J family beta-CASP ribonuclease [Candidatus Woesearchaeota archaeon]|nr:RNase J family beta-CASP ribonuclease [Candidatus Woesearchaeota archaeon]